MHIACNLNAIPPVTRWRFVSEIAYSIFYGAVQILQRSKKNYYQERAARRLRDSEGALTDTVLIQACLSGDAEAWDALIERYEGFIYSQALHCDLPPAEASDVFQDVCLRLYHHLDELRDTSRLAGWISSTTRREAWRVGKRLRSTLSTDNPELNLTLENGLGLTQSDDNNLENTVLAAADRALVWQAMDSLPDQCRQLLTLLYSNESCATYSEITQNMNLPAGSIGPTRARCLKRLQKILLELGF